MFDRIRGMDMFVGEIVKMAGENDFVVTDRILFASMSYEMRDRPNNIYMPFKEGGIITNHFQMNSSLVQDHDNNFFLIGSKSDVSYLVNESEIKLLKEFDVSFSSSKLKIYEVVFK